MLLVVRRSSLEVRQLLTILDQAYNRRSWHGTNLRGSIRGLSLPQVTWRPQPNRHNIWELVLHAAYWKYAVWRRLSAVSRGSFPLGGSNWFARAGAADDREWRSDVALLDAMHESLRGAVAGLSAADLERIPRGSTVSNFAVISGVAAHDLYHAGQIQLLKALMKGRRVALRMVVAAAVSGAVFSGCARLNLPAFGHVSHFVPIAEGLTAETQSDAVRLAPRRLSAPDLVRACATVRPVDRLRVVPDVVTLAVDERFPLTRVSVVAINSADIVVPAVPIVFEAEETSPAVIALRSDDPDVNEGRVHATAPGRFRLRVRTICGTVGAERMIRGRVTP